MAALFACYNANALMINNGSFESPAVPAGLSSANPDQWTAGGTIFMVNSGGGLLPSPQDGQQYVDIELGQLYQAVSLPGAGTYVFSWYYNTLATGGTTAYNVILQENLSTNGTVKAFSTAFNPSDPWKEGELEFTASGPSTFTLIFAGGAGGRGGVFLDNVTVRERTMMGSVPESCSTVGLLGFAMGAMAFVSRRRSEKISA